MVKLVKVDSGYVDIRLLTRASEVGHARVHLHPKRIQQSLRLISFERARSHSLLFKIAARANCKLARIRSIRLFLDQNFWSFAWFNLVDRAITLKIARLQQDQGWNAFIYLRLGWVRIPNSYFLSRVGTFLFWAGHWLKIWLLFAFTLSFYLWSGVGDRIRFFINVLMVSLRIASLCKCNCRSSHIYSRMNAFLRHIWVFWICQGSVAPRVHSWSCCLLLLICSLGRFI